MSLSGRRRGGQREKEKERQKERERRVAYLVHGPLRGVPGGEGDEGVAAVGTRHGVHHESQVPDSAAAFEQRYEFVLVHVLGDLAAEHLAAGARRAPLPPGRRTPILALTCATQQQYQQP